jgi:aryl-alcohol dehydrogenase-like predicted oxidoreductase
VDVYYLHVPDHSTPIERTLDAIEELLSARKILHFGISNYASWQILAIMMSCDRRGIERPVISQLLYNLLIRQLDIEYFKFVREYPIHTTVYNALAGGLLSGRHSASAGIPKGSRFENNRLYQQRYWTDRFFDLVGAYQAVASDAGMSLVELAYAWLAGRARVDSILVGPATVEQLDAAIDGRGRTLSAETRARIDEIHTAFAGTNASYAR